MASYLLQLVRIRSSSSTSLISFHSIKTFFIVKGKNTNLFPKYTQAGTAYKMNIVSNILATHKSQLAVINKFIQKNHLSKDNR